MTTKSLTTFEVFVTFVTMILRLLPKCFSSLLIETWLAILVLLDCFPQESWLLNFGSGFLQHSFTILCLPLRFWFFLEPVRIITFGSWRSQKIFRWRSFTRLSSSFFSLKLHWLVLMLLLPIFGFEWWCVRAWLYCHCLDFNVLVLCWHNFLSFMFTEILTVVWLTQTLVH